MKFFKTKYFWEQGVAVLFVAVLLVADRSLATLAQPIRFVLYFPVQACLWLAKSSGMTVDNANLFALFVGGIFLVLYWYALVVAITTLLTKRWSK